MWFNRDLFRAVCSAWQRVNVASRPFQLQDKRSGAGKHCVKNSNVGTTQCLSLTGSLVEPGTRQSVTTKPMPGPWLTCI
jgi:hypothetical protein